MRALAAGFPLTTTFPEVGSIRWAIRRSSVDLPQPDGPISETNSPGSMMRSMSTSASTRLDLPALNTFESFDTTTALNGAPSQALLDWPVAHQHDVQQHHRAVEQQPDRGCAGHGRVRFGRIAGGRLRVRDHGPTDSSAAARRDLGHDHANHRERGCQL